jgi:hypothetical protein
VREKEHSWIISSPFFSDYTICAKVSQQLSSFAYLSKAKVRQAFDRFADNTSNQPAVAKLLEVDKLIALPTRSPSNDATLALLLHFLPIRGMPPLTRASPSTQMRKHISHPSMIGTFVAAHRK